MRPQQILSLCLGDMDNSNSQMFASGYFSHSQIIYQNNLLAFLCLWNLNSTSNTPVTPRRLSCQFSANQCKAESSANVHKHRNETCAKGHDIITRVISANQHFAPTFSMPIFKFQRHSCKLSFLPHTPPPPLNPLCQSAPEGSLAGYYC